MKEEVSALELLLQVNEEQGKHVSEALITKCYDLQKKYQYEESGDIEKKMGKLVEEEINSHRSNTE